jgi:hypothetical protein
MDDQHQIRKAGQQEEIGTSVCGRGRVVSWSGLGILGTGPFGASRFSLFVVVSTMLDEITMALFLLSVLCLMDVSRLGLSLFFSRHIY